MSEAFQIDWFDGSIVENRRPNPPSNEQAKASTSQQTPEKNGKKAIGFRKLLDISQLEPPILNVELESRPGFWLLFSTDLSDDFIVLIVRTLSALYKSLNPGDNTKLIQLLETNFMKSDFLKRLNNYVTNLANVKFSQKSRNSQLWDDVNRFFCDLVELYKGIFCFYKNRREYLEELYKVVETTDTSAIGVQENHSETINESFYNNISQLVLDLKKELDKITDIKKEKKAVVQGKVKEYKPDGIDLFYYKNMPIFPASIDFSSTEILDYIAPNIVNGVYSSIEHYLDLQFKLLREDCFRPLVEGIRQYKKDGTVKNCKDIRVYQKALITGTEVSNNRVGYVVDLSLSASDLDTYKNAKTFMNGSLLLFTSDNLQNVLCGTVINSNRTKSITVSFPQVLPGDVFSREFLLIESEVYFEPYHKVLKVLQNASTSSLPMQRYIVYADKTIYPPLYLRKDTTYSIKDNEGSRISFEVLNMYWPSMNYFGLDESQMEAFRFALTKEFVVIQGPPGTGKTFLGTKIAGMLLQNVSFKQSPMLIICSTNHALDQFLEGLLKYTKDIIRFGGQSKSEVLQNYNLNKLRNQKPFTYLYFKKKDELKKVYEKINMVALKIDLCSNSVISYECLQPYLPLHYNIYNGNRDSISNWLFGNGISIPSDEGCIKYDDLKICYSEDISRRAIIKLKDTMELMKSATDFYLRYETIHKCELIIREEERKLALFKEMFSKRHKLAEAGIKYINNNNFNMEERWAVYFALVELLRKKLNDEKTELFLQYTALTQEMDELKDTMDCAKLKDVKVVGMTTTMAAGRHQLLKKLKPFVVIVEEAAEVLETHIVASLTDECKHLMLIGDHQQLRPTSAHYVVGKKFNLEVSLFERMVRNGIHIKTLTTQRRMRKEIMDLLVPTIYDKLECHPSVLSYPDVRGMAKNLCFFDHTVFEDTGADDSSCKNNFEAQWCVSLANYFIKLKYDPSEVTILTTYSAQVSLITSLSEKYPLIKDVHITTVDNYQGEENRIVILSLVRSNKEKNIGFLATANRVCVALSRAKEGLYIFGNMSCLETSQLWRTMKAKLEEQNAIGNKFLLVYNDKNLANVEVNSASYIDSLVPEDVQHNNNINRTDNQHGRIQHYNNMNRTDNQHGRIQHNNNIKWTDNQHGRIQHYNNMNRTDNQHGRIQHNNNIKWTDNQHGRIQHYNNMNRTDNQHGWIQHNNNIKWTDNQHGRIQHNNNINRTDNQIINIAIGIYTVVKNLWVRFSEFIRED